MYVTNKFKKNAAIYVLWRRIDNLVDGHSVSVQLLLKLRM